MTANRTQHSGAWKTVHLKPYNFKAKGAPTPSGALHPRKFHAIFEASNTSLSDTIVNKVRQEFRQIFFEMGFEEMPTNR